MKIRSVRANNHRHAFEVCAGRRTMLFPYAKTEPAPSAADPVVCVAADAELGREAFTFRLMSGRDGTVHVEQVLDYNLDPGYLRDLLVHRLTVLARTRLAESPLSRSEIIRRLGTSPAQFYRLLDTTNTRKTVDRMLELLYVLDCDVDLVVRARKERALSPVPLTL